MNKALREFSLRTCAMYLFVVTCLSCFFCSVGVAPVLSSLKAFYRLSRQILCLDPPFLERTDVAKLP